MLTVLKKKKGGKKTNKQNHMVFTREYFPDVTDFVTKASPVSHLEHPVLKTDPSIIKLAGFSSRVRPVRSHQKHSK